MPCNMSNMHSLVITTTIVWFITGRLRHIMWSRKWHNLPLQTYMEEEWYIQSMDLSCRLVGAWFWLATWLYFHKLSPFPIKKILTILPQILVIFCHKYLWFMSLVHFASSHSTQLHTMVPPFWIGNVNTSLHSSSSLLWVLDQFLSLKQRRLQKRLSTHLFPFLPFEHL
jgi:hypothetical protein